MVISPDFRFKAVFFGTPEFSVPALKALIDSDHEILAVVTQPDRHKGRGRHLTASPVKVEAQKQGLRILQPSKVKDASFIKELELLMPSVIVVAAYGQILPLEILRLPGFGCINIHASLLPKYRGAAPVNWAIINGEHFTGVSIMLMDKGMDTGPVLLQREVKIEDCDTVGSLSSRLSRIGADALVEALRGLAEGRLKPVPQKGEVSYAPLLKKTDALIPWSESAEKLCNFIRGVNPWPGAYSFLDSERVKILKADAVEGQGEAGVIHKADKKELLVGTGRGLLSILEIQPPDKPVMPIDAFLQGRKLKEGIKFSKSSY